jgi:WhiB family transcriptional regulator, redox-sensing transcriptional regulator
VDWLFSAACRTEDPELFFPVGTSGPALVQTARAKAVCRRCPVMIQCRTWALTTGQAAGVWGGVSEDERRAMRRHDQVDLLLPRGLRVPHQPQDEPRAGTEGSGRTRTRMPTRLSQPGKPAVKESDEVI